MNTSNPAGRYPPPEPGTGPTRKRSAGSSQACSRRRASSSGERMLRSPASTALVQFRISPPSRAKRAGQASSASGPAAARQALQTAARRASGTRSAERAAEDRADVLEAAHPGIIPDAPGRRRRGSRDRRPRPADACRWRSRAPARAPAGAPSRLCARPRSSSLATSSSSSTGRTPRTSLHEVGLGGEQREHGGALLALRAVVAQVALALREGQLVVMRPDRRAAALDVARAAGLELGQLTGLVLGPARLVAQLDRLLELADRARCARERLAQRQHEPAARAPDLRSQLRQLRLPGRQRVVCARARRAAGAAADCAAAARRRRRRRPPRSAARSGRLRGRGSGGAAPARPS